MGGVTQSSPRRPPQEVGIPFIYALLENKQEASYKKVFDIVIERARHRNINVRLPRRVMSDFELAIINAARNTFGADKVGLCLFHLGQSVFRHIQMEGLQQQYSSEDDPTIRDAAHKMVSLAFVPPQDVQNHCQLIETEMPPDFLPVFNYFKATYVRGTPRGRGRGRRFTPPRYSPFMWCQYNAVLDRTARTNNISEGWHNRLQVVMAKDHPSFYNFLAELKKEQADSEVMMRQLNLGQRIRKGQDPKRRRREDRIFSIVGEYDQYVANNEVSEYLKLIGHNLKL